MPPFTDIVLTRRRRSSVREQLITQLEMKMLAGELAPGQRLPSIRALARMLAVNPNTVSAAYRRLEDLGHLTTWRGAGVFVDDAQPPGITVPPNLAALVHGALTGAVDLGHSAADIREAATVWLRTPPPDRIVVFDPVPEMARLLAYELQDATACRAEVVTVPDLEAGPPHRLAGGLVVTLPYQVKRLAEYLPPEAFEVLTIQVPATTRQAIAGLPDASTLLIVASTPVVQKFGGNLVRALRGAELLVQTAHLSEEGVWRPLLRAADLVITDALSTPCVRAARQTRVSEVRLVTPPAIARVNVLLRLPGNPSLKLRTHPPRPAAERKAAPGVRRALRSPRISG